MKSVFKRRIFIAGSTGLLLLAGALSAQNGEVTVKDPWVRVPGAGQKNAAAFMTIENHGTAAHKIVSVATDVAEKAELHEMKMNPATKMMSMSPVQDIAVPAGGSAELKPGGYHVMLFNVKSAPRAGDTVTLTLKLDDGTTVAVAAKARPMDDEAGMMKRKM